MATSERSLLAWPPLAGLLRGPKRREPMPWLKPGIFLGSLAPLTYILIRARAGDLGANPIAQIENELGLSALVMLVASLACTPAKRLFGWTWQMRIRRQIGLWAFFYASLHFLTYLVLDMFFDWGTMIEDITSRPFITVGFAAFLMLAPLALTSTNRWVKRLGYKRWARIHTLVYLAGGLAVLHFIWRVKIDFSQPLTYAGVVAILLGIRALFWLRQRNKKRVR